MKKSVCLVVVVLFCLISCAPVSPVSSESSEEGMSTAVVSITLEKIATTGLPKAAADDKNPAYAIVLANGVKDSFPVSDWGNIVKSYSQGKGSTYQFFAKVYNSSGRTLNYNREAVTGIVPNADSFAVAINCVAAASEFVLKIPVAGTPAFSTAEEFKVNWLEITNFEPRRDSLKLTITPGSQDTVVLRGMMNLSSEPFTRYSFTVKVKCTDLVYYLGVDTAEVYPSQNGTLDMLLDKYDPNGSLAKVSVTLQPVCTFEAIARLKKAIAGLKQ